MESKQAILSAIKGHALPSQPAPDLAVDHGWIRYDRPVEHFQAVLESVGGRSVRVPNIAAIDGELVRLPQFQSARKIYSSIAGIGKANVELNQIDDPHELADVDFVIARAEFGVAENGALWVTDGGLKHRVVYFITQHLSLVVPVREIVNNMHDAYRRLSFDRAGFGVFISGPSKTADIEQSLVIGAHGARSLTVFLVDELA